jgi:CheY-like chemotaxis protein
MFLIALTGYGQPEDRARAIAAGFDVHLTKPMDLDALESLLGTLRVGLPERPEGHAFA